MPNSGLTIYWDYHCNFVFYGCSTQQIVTFVAACIVTFALAFLMNAIKPIQMLILSQIFQSQGSNCETNQYELVCPKQEQCSLPKEAHNQHLINEEQTENQSISMETIIKVVSSIITAALHISINLILMQLNGFVIIAVIMGYASGYYIFQQAPNPQKNKPQGQQQPRNAVSNPS